MSSKSCLKLFAQLALNRFSVSVESNGSVFPAPGEKDIHSYLNLFARYFGM